MKCNLAWDIFWNWISFCSYSSTHHSHTHTHPHTPTHLRWGGCESKGIIILGLIPRRPASVDMLSSDSWPKRYGGNQPIRKCCYSVILFENDPSVDLRIINQFVSLRFGWIFKRHTSVFFYEVITLSGLTAPVEIAGMSIMYEKHEMLCMIITNTTKFCRTPPAVLLEANLRFQHISCLKKNNSFLSKASKLYFPICQPNPRSLLSVIIHVSSGSEGDISLWSHSHNIKF